MAGNAAIGSYVTLYNATGATQTSPSTNLDLEQSAATVGILPNEIRTAGVGFRVNFTRNSTDVFILTPQVSDDGGTTWYNMHEYDTTLNASADDFQIEVGPFVGSETHLRMAFVLSAGAAGASTVIKIEGRLNGIYKITTTS